MLARVTDIFTVSDFSLRFVRVHLVYLFFAVLIIAYCMCFLVGRIIQHGVIEVISLSSPCCTYALLDPILGISYNLRQFEGQGYVIFSPSRQRYAFVSSDPLEGAILNVVNQSEEERIVQPLMNSQRISALAWSADSEHLAFSVMVGGVRSVYIFDLNTDTISPLTPQLPNCMLPAWSPDEHYIAVVCDGELNDARGIYLVDRTLYSIEHIADEVGSIQALQWSPDGTEIAFQTTERVTPYSYMDVSHLYIMLTNGSNLHQLTPSQLSIASFAWSPDSSSILFLASSARSFEKLLYLMNRDGGNVELLTIPVERYTVHIAWYAGEVQG